MVDLDERHWSSLDPGFTGLPVSCIPPPRYDGRHAACR